MAAPSPTEQLLLCILGNNNNARVQAESQLKQMKTQPEPLVTSMMEVLVTSPNEHVCTALCLSSLDSS
jgi:hypothetical protein